MRWAAFLAMLLGGCSASAPHPAAVNDPAPEPGATREIAEGTSAVDANEERPSPRVARAAPPESQEFTRDPTTPSSPLRAGEIGRSVRGAPIIARDFGSGIKKLYLIGLIHGDEAEGFGALAALERVLHDAADASGVRVRLVPTMNPDGQARRSRRNARAVDLNRNWPASNFRPSGNRGPAPTSEPEVAAVLADLERFAPDALVVFHSISRSAPFVNFDGPEQAARLAVAFADAARDAHGGDWSVVADMGYSTPGSLGTWAGIDSGIPTLTIEFKARHDPDEAQRAAIAGVRAVIRLLGGPDTLRPED